MESPKVAVPNVRLRQERLNRGWSQADVAEKIGSDPKTVGRWERGVTFPSPYLCQRLCMLYGKTVQELALVKEQHQSPSDQKLSLEPDNALPLPTLVDTLSQPEPQIERGKWRRWRTRKTFFTLLGILLALILLLGIVLSASLLPSANPYTNQGNIALNDNLGTNTAASWSLSNTDEGECFFANGAYHIRGIKTGGYMKLCLAAETYFSNFTYEVKMQVIIGDCGGLALRATFPQLYYFVVCQDGNYRFVRYDPNQKNRRIIVAGVSSAIHRGLNNTNVVAVVAEGENFTLFINHIAIYHGTDKTYFDGQIGLLVHTCSIVYLDPRPDVCAVPVEAAFSDAKVWKG